MSETLLELKRNQFISSSKQSDNYEDQSKGRNRYFRRMHQKIDKSVSHLNKMDMNKLFSEGILDINLDVKGETDNYVVRVSFGRFLQELHKEVQQQEGRFSLPVVTRALVKAFNTDDVLVRCTCKDFNYRQSFFLSMNKGIAGEMETRPSNITNPNDTKGRGCKHIQSVLTNNSWLSRVARVIWNYVNYMREHFAGIYAEKIYPAIYEKDYDEIYQQDLDILDKKDLKTNDVNDNSDIIDTSNKWAKEKSQFKPGNEYRYKTNTDDQNQMNLNLEEPKNKEFDINSEIENV